MRKNIVFTKLGTVKTDTFERSIDEFFQLMYNGIFQDIEKSGVRYDEKNDCYLIRYDKTTYNVKYGNELLNKNSDKEDIVKTLNKLIELSNKQTKIHKETEIEKKEEEKKDKKAIINGEKGVFDSDEDKERYIKYLKEELHSKTRYKYELTKNHRGLYRLTSLLTATFDFSLFVGSMLTIVLAGFGAIAVPESVGFYLLIPYVYGLVKFIIDRVSILPDAFGDEYGYEKKSVSILGKILGKTLTNRKIKKRIKVLQESLKQNKVYDTKGVTALNEFLKQEEDKEISPIQKTVKDMSQEFRKVQSKINEVLSEVKRKEFSEELLSMLDNYKKDIAESQEKGNHMIVYKNAINQVVGLAHRINETLRKEEQEKKNQEEFGNMFEEVERVETRVAGK